MEQDVIGKGLKIGILGCGRLGQALALALINRGFKKDNLLLSHGGGEATRQKLEVLSLAACVTANDRLLDAADILLITLRPRDAGILAGAKVPAQTAVASAMAGVPLALLERLLDRPVCRMMFSGPDTILSGKGVAAMYPENGHIRLLLDMLHLVNIKLSTESELDVFTAGVCLPAAILKAGPIDGQKQAVERLNAGYPLLASLYVWAGTVLPDFRGEAERAVYINEMITKGGVTEAIVGRLESGALLDEALLAGIARSRSIAADIQRSLENHEKGA